MKFTARVYKVSKNKKYHSYFATIKQSEFEHLKLENGSAILLEKNDHMFPTVIRKLYTSRNRFMYGFPIPQDIGKGLQFKSDIDFEFLKTSLNRHLIENKVELCLPNILPKKTIRNNDFCIFDLNDKVLVWIYSTGNKWYLLPRYIPLSKNGYEVLELFGAYLCEALKARKIGKHLDRLSYSSSEVDQIEWFISSMEHLFGIKKSEWSVQILLRDYNEQNKDYIVKHWINAELEKENIKIIENSLVNDKFGVCLVNIYNSSLAETIYEVFQHCKQMALENPDNSLKFFRGLSRGDLGVTIKGSGNTISFTNKSKDNILLFKEICSNLNIKTSKIIEDKRVKKECWFTLIHDFKSFEKIISLNAISHRRRKFYFYSNFKKCRGCLPFKYIGAISKGYDTNEEISECLQLSLVNVMAILSKYRKIGLLNAELRSSGQTHKIHYSLSENGQKLLEFYENIEKEIKYNNI